jgi:hypothetical protein
MKRLKEIFTFELVWGIGLGVYVRAPNDYGKNYIDIYIALPFLIINIEL